MTLHRLLRWTLLALFGLAANTPAVVLFGGDSGYTTPPADDPGWARVGRVGTNGSGVYLGNGWVLTANHVSSKTTLVIEGDKTYTVLPGAENTKRLRNTSDTDDIDLYMFRVGVAPGDGLYGAPNAAIASALPSAGADGTHIGTGRGQTSPTATTWYVDTGPDPWVWNLADFPEADRLYQGYTWGGTASRDTRWDLQRLHNTNADFDGMEGFSTRFRNAAGYGMAVEFDSGSPIFFKSGDDWQLAGIAITIGTYSGQPAQTSVYRTSSDGNLTYFANLAAYRTQVLNQMAIPEPGSVVLVSLGLAAALVRRRRVQLVGRSPR